MEIMLFINSRCNCHLYDAFPYQMGSHFTRTRKKVPNFTVQNGMQNCPHRDCGWYWIGQDRELDTDQWYSCPFPFSRVAAHPPAPTRMRSQGARAHGTLGQVSARHTRPPTLVHRLGNGREQTVYEAVWSPVDHDLARRRRETSFSRP